MGDWYVVSEIRASLERNCIDSVESYRFLSDNSIDNWLSCRKKSVDAPMKRVIQAQGTITDTDTNARWQLRFYKIFRAQYWVIDLDPDYQWAVVRYPSRSYGWILARSRSLSESIYAGILDRAQSQGYDKTRFKQVTQRE